MRLFRNNQALCPQNLINQGRLPDVWPAHETYFNCVFHVQIFNICSSLRCKGVFWFNEELLKILVIKVRVLPWVRIDFSEVFLPFFNANTLLFYLFHFLLQFIDKLLEFLHALLLKHL